MFSTNKNQQKTCAKISWQAYAMKLGAPNGFLHGSVFHQRRAGIPHVDETNPWWFFAEKNMIPTRIIIIRVKAWNRCTWELNGCELCFLLFPSSGLMKHTSCPWKSTFWISEIDPLNFCRAATVSVVYLDWFQNNKACHFHGLPASFSHHFEPWDNLGPRS